MVQLTAAWQSHANSVILAIEAIESSLASVKEITPTSKKPAIDAISAPLVEYLQLFKQKTKVMIGDLQYINSRGQAQTGAVSLLLRSQPQIAQ